MDIKTTHTDTFLGVYFNNKLNLGHAYRKSMDAINILTKRNNLPKETKGK